MKQRLQPVATFALAAVVATAALAGVMRSPGDSAYAAAQAVPANTSPPTISGDARVSETLTANPGTWSNNPTSFAYQWQRCNSAGASCADIPGETRPTRIVDAGDVGSTLRVRVVASNADGASPPAFSAPSAIVQPAQSPVNTRLPAVSGTARVGETLTADRGEWANNPTSFAYQWQRCNAAGASCTNIPNETSSVRIVTQDDAGNRLRVIVTASNAAASSSAASQPTDVVAPRGAAPASTAAPAVSGEAEAGKTLTVSTGTWANNPTSFGYQWQRCDANGGACSNIAGERSANRVVAADDVGSRLRALVTATNAFGSTQVASTLSDVVRAGLPAGAVRLPSGRISIPASSVSPPERLIVDGVRFVPGTVQSRAAPITAHFHVVDTRGYVVRDALVFARTTPLLTSTPPEQATRQDGWVTMTFLPRRTFPLRDGYYAQFFVRARKQGDNLLAGVSTRRLVQLRTATPR